MGSPTRVRAGTLEFSAHRALLLARAQWLLDKGIPQWAFLLSPEGERVVEGRVRDHEVLLFSDEHGPLATLAVYLADTEVWPATEFPPDEALHLHGLATRLDAPKGTGAAVLQWAEPSARARGKTRLRLDCWDTNEKLKSFYAGLGYLDRGLCLPYGPEYPTRRWEKVVG